MPLDAVTLSGVVNELKPYLENSRIDKIYQVTKDEFIFQLRSINGNVKLLITANQSQPRLHLTQQKIENPASPPKFCMFLRKYLINARIISVTQPSMERLVSIELETLNEMGDLIHLNLILEAIGRRSNLVLVGEDGRIMDCLHKIGFEMSEERPVLPGFKYHLPEKQNSRYNPLSLSYDEISELYSNAPTERKITEWMLDNFVGISPLICRELVCQSIGDLDSRISLLSDDKKDNFLRVFWNFLENVRNNRLIPFVLLKNGAFKDFSCMYIYQYGLSMECRKYDSFSLMLDDFFAEKERSERIKSKGSELIKTVNNAKARLNKKINLQQKELKASEDRDKFRIYGDLITCNIYKLSYGMKSFQCENFYDEAMPIITVSLDPLLTPQQNAAKYYKKYNKAKTANKILTEQLDKAYISLKYLDSVLDSISRCNGEKDLLEIRQELEDTGYIRKKKSDSRKKQIKRVMSKPLEFMSDSGLRISVGKNNMQNDLLTFKKAGKNDIWLHVKDIHGSHVILWCDSGQTDEKSILQAATLAAYYSQAKNGTHVPVDYTKVRNVKKPNGTPPGFVNYFSYKTIFVNPDEQAVQICRNNLKK